MSPSRIAWPLSYPRSRCSSSLRVAAPDRECRPDEREQVEACGEGLRGRSVGAASERDRRQEPGPDERSLHRKIAITGAVARGKVAALNRPLCCLGASFRMRSSWRRVICNGKPVAAIDDDRGPLLERSGGALPVPQDHHARHGARPAHVVGHPQARVLQDRKSTRLNSSHSQTSYAVFCLKKKK